MKLVVIDHVSPLYADEIASMLRESGFDVKYDNLPRVSLAGHSIAPITTPIYVPERQVKEARRVLSAYYEQAHADMKDRIDALPPWWCGLKIFIKPALLAIVPGTVLAIIFQQPTIFAAGWFISFILVLQARSYLSNNNAQ